MRHYRNRRDLYEDVPERYLELARVAIRITEGEMAGYDDEGNRIGMARLIDLIKNALFYAELNEKMLSRAIRKVFSEIE